MQPAVGRRVCVLMYTFTWHHILLFSENTAKQDIQIEFILQKLRIYGERAILIDKNYNNKHSPNTVINYLVERQNIHCEHEIQFTQLS